MAATMSHDTMVRAQPHKPRPGVLASSAIVVVGIVFIFVVIFIFVVFFVVFLVKVFNFRFLLLL